MVLRDYLHGLNNQMTYFFDLILLKKTTMKKLGFPEGYIGALVSELIHSF
ncbi:MAG: hypothetical protein ACFFAN_12510 [Promethearchaeota archaeon]